MFTLEVGDSFGQCLSTFLLGLSGDTTLAKRSRAMFDADGNIRDANNAPKSMDVSSEGMILKKQREMEALLARRDSVKPQNLKQKMYDEDGNLTKQWSEKGDDDEVEVNGRLNVSAMAAANRASREVDDVLTTKKCGGTARDRLSIYKKQCAPSGLHIDEHDVKRMEGLSTTVKNAPISQKKEKKREDEEEDIDDEDKGLSKELRAQKKQELLTISCNMSLTRGERARKIDAVKRKYAVKAAPVPAEPIQDQDGYISPIQSSMSNGVDVSIQGTLRAKEAELAALRASSTQRHGVKDKIYDDSGKLAAQWDKVKTLDKLKQDEDVSIATIKSEADTIKEQRSKELQEVMRTKGLSRGERAERIEAVKRKYDSPSGTKVNAIGNLSAVDAAAKHHNELGALRSRLHEVTQGSKQENYNSKGVLHQQWSKVQLEDIRDIDAHIDAKRKEYFQHLDDEESLRERIATRDKLLAAQRKEKEENSKLKHKSSLSTCASNEIEMLRSNATDAKKGLYDENGALVKQWKNKNADDDAVEDTKEHAAMETQKKEELLSIMHDKNLTRGERTNRIDAVKRKYSTASTTASRVDDEEITVVTTSVKMPESVEVSGTTNALDAQRRQEFESIMRDRSLNRDQRKTALEMMKKKYSTGKQQATPSEEEDTKQGPSILDAARKARVEGAKPTQVKPLNAKMKPIVLQDKPQEDKPQESSPFKAFMAKSVDEQRREELQLVMKDRSLSKEERSRRMEEIKVRYEASQAASPGVSPERVDKKLLTKRSSGNSIGKNQTLDEQRRIELRVIMKNRNIDIETKNSLLEEVKVKYDSLAVRNEDSPSKSSDTAKVKKTETKEGLQKKPPSPKKPTPPSPPKKASAFSAHSFMKDLEDVKKKASNGSSVKDMKAAFGNGGVAPPIHYDPVAFAVKQNKNQSCE